MAQLLNIKGNNSILQVTWYWTWLISRNHGLWRKLQMLKILEHKQDRSGIWASWWMNCWPEGTISVSLGRNWLVYTLLLWPLPPAPPPQDWTDLEDTNLVYSIHWQRSISYSQSSKAGNTGLRDPPMTSYACFTLKTRYPKVAKFLKWPPIKRIGKKRSSLLHPFKALYSYPAPPGRAAKGTAPYWPFPVPSLPIPTG